jgi:hypothetical protein
MKKNSYLLPFQSNRQIGATYRNNAPKPYQYTIQFRNTHTHNSIEGKHCNDGTTEFDESHGFIHTPFRSHYKASVFTTPNASPIKPPQSTQLLPFSNHNRNGCIAQSYTTAQYHKQAAFTSPRKKENKAVTYKALHEALDKIAGNSSNSIYSYCDEESTILRDEKKQLDELIESISIALRERTQHNASLRLHLNYLIGLK